MKKLLMIFITLLIGLSASAQTQPDEIHIIVTAGSEEQHYPISMSQHTKITFTSESGNNGKLNIISDNGVIATYDRNNLKVSFTPNASTAAMKIVFKDNAPIETEHEFDNLQMYFTQDGCETELHVNDGEVWYQVDDITEITFFEGTPSIHLTANEDPDNYGNYYTTFYSGLEAYSLPKGVKAYTARIEEYDNKTVVRLTAIESAIIPQDEAVLLYTRNGSDITMNVADGTGVAKSDGNMFDGVDVATDQAGSSNYMLSYGQNGLGFYKMSDSMLLSANKAFLPMSKPNMAKGLRMVFDNTDGGVTGVNAINVDVNADVNIYNIGGIRLNKLQKGINIVGGKKIVVK